MIYPLKLFVQLHEGEKHWFGLLAMILVSKCTIASRVDMSLTNPKILFNLEVLHRSLDKIILLTNLEWVDIREKGRWPFPHGLAIGMTMAVSQYSGIFLRGVERVGKPILSVVTCCVF